MPELPEVEVVRRGLAAHVLRRPIAQVEVLHPRPVRRHLAGPDDFAARLTGRTFTAACRRGKYLWLPLDSGDALLAHLGMSGQLLVQPATAPPERHLRVRFTLAPEEVGVPERQRGPRNPGPSTVEEVAQQPSRVVEEVAQQPFPVVEEVAQQPSRNPLELRFVDQRMFGGLSISTGGAELPPEIAHIARDPMDPEFDVDDFARRVRRSTSGIKRQLLNQSLVSGVGNIYADEALWRARLHGDRPGNRLTRAQVVGLVEQIREVMTDALGQGGTSFDALYVNVNGQSGYFDRSLHVYGREGEPCGRCGTPIVRRPFMNRSSYSCPRCQRRPRPSRA